MKLYIKRNIIRPKKDIINAYKKLDVSSIYEAQGKTGLLNNNIRPMTTDGRIVGPAVVATCFAGDNLMIHAAIEQVQPGDVLVVAVIGDSSAGMVGDLIASALQKRGVIGLIIDASIRDLVDLKKMNFPVWSKGVYSKGTTKEKGGWINKSAVVGGVNISPGDLIVADQDGVVVVEKDQLEKTLEKTKQRLENEQSIREKINNGEISLDFHNLRQTLKSEKVIYID